MAHLKNSWQRKVSPIFFPLLTNCQWQILTCLGLRAPSGGTNFLLLQATVNAKLRAPFGLYLSVSILLVFSSLFLRFLEYFC